MAATDDKPNAETATLEQSSPSRTVFALTGLACGFGVGVWAMVESAARFRDLRMLVVLAAGMLFGVVVGLNLHSTQKWGRSKPMFVLRWTLACGGAAGAIALVGYFVGMLPWKEVGQIGTLGAVVGLMFAVSWLFEEWRAA